MEAQVLPLRRDTLGGAGRGNGLVYLYTAVYTIHANPVIPSIALVSRT